ncbi:MAG TPA: histidinol dehydrogenase, partial [Acidimicrobiales bacterium]|nr:histidinol dehydrogenase [Acidimicrobiales bacterium]
ILRRLDLRHVTDDLRNHLPRPDVAAGESQVAAVHEILARVRDHGDDAVRDLTEQFDGARLDSLRVPSVEMEAALASLPPLLREAMEASRASILKYQRSTLRPDECHERDGIVVRDLRRPVDRAGLYIPGGLARYPSTVLMTALPARVAGVAELVLCTPPEKAGSVDGPTLAAAALAGVDEVYRIGGAQAIAAMAYGTETIRPVDVIVGPGNVYVSIAKREVAQAGLVGVPSAFAGPSEVVVIADETTPVDFAAIDVIVQAEHGPDGLAWLVTWSEEAADRITEAIARLTEQAPRRNEIEANFARGGYCVLVDSPERAMEVANLVAPEHLELMNADPESLVPLVRSAGAVFCGPYAPASVGDYMAGPSHVLPTNGSARFSSALRVQDFSKQIHLVSLDQPTLAKIAPHVAALAEAEGLPAHALSVRMRESP